MIDVARYFIPKEDILRLIDCISLLKINTLHLHLTDDNGWRIEIKKTSFAYGCRLPSCRTGRLAFPWEAQPTARWAYREKRILYPDGHTRDCGICFLTVHWNYTWNRYAGTQQCGSCSYPMLACPVVDKFIGVLPGLGGNHADIIYCAGNENVYHFLQDVSWWGNGAFFLPVYSFRGWWGLENALEAMPALPETYQ